MPMVDTKLVMPVTLYAVTPLVIHTTPQYLVLARESCITMLEVFYKLVSIAQSKVVAQTCNNDNNNKQILSL